MFMDIVFFFDKEDMFDCLTTMEELGINKKAIRMWYLLNKNTKIKVKTAFGTTEEASVGDCLGQGTCGAGLVSAANLDLGLQKSFNTSNKIMHFGSVRLQPLCYQDDVGTLCTNVAMARSQAKKLTQMIKEKTLDAHPDKSGIVLLGSKRFKDRVEKELIKEPINFNKFNLKIKTEDKYLGQMIKEDLSASALATVKERSGKIKGAAIEVKQIIGDFEMQTLGGLAAAWEIWERALIPSLLSGAGTWLGDIDEAIKCCNDIQDFYWRIILNISDSVPKLALRCETFMRDCKWRIWEEKCLFLMRIQNLEDGSLAKIIYQEAESNGWPGLGNEVRQICRELDIPDINSYRIQKAELQKAIQFSHKKDILKQFESSKKLQDIKESNFDDIQPYFHDKNIENARITFRIRTKMLKKSLGIKKLKLKILKMV